MNSRMAASSRNYFVAQLTNKWVCLTMTTIILDQTDAAAMPS